MSLKKLNKNDAPKQITNHEKVMQENDFIVSKTDTKGVIHYGNRSFVSMSGYDKKEIIGANHNLIRHPFMPQIAFKLAWELIAQKKEFFGFVKNLCKDGGFYWVFAYITADVDKQGNIIGYTSFRRKPSPSGVEEIRSVYKLLNEAEARGGMQASEKLLNTYLLDNKTTYEKFVHELQTGVVA